MGARRRGPGPERARAASRPRTSPRAATIATGPLRARTAAEPPPERSWPSSTRHGAQLVSLNPLRDTLEDFFVQHVAERGPARARTPAVEGRHDGAIRHVAVNVFKESVRDKVLYNLVVFAVLLIVDLVPARPAHRRPGRQDHQGPRAWRPSSVFGLFIAIFIGIGLVWKEVERRSIYALLAKPISRGEFVARQIPRPRADAAVNVAVMTARVLRGARVHGRGRAVRRCRRLARARRSIRRC